MALRFQVMHDGCVGVLAVDHRSDQRGVPAERLVFGVAGDELEAAIDRDDVVFGIGDHYRVGCVFEDGGGQPQLVGSVPLFGDVLKDPDDAALRPGRIKRATAQ